MLKGYQAECNSRYSVTPRIPTLAIMKERCKKLLKNSVLVIFNLVSLDSAVVK